MTTLLVIFDELLVAARKARRWHVEEALSGEPLTCAAADPHHPGRVYCGTEEGLWRSEDPARSWYPIGQGLPVRRITAVAVDPLNSRAGTPAVYAGTEPSRLFRSKDGGETWDDLTALAALPSSHEWSFPPRPQTHHVRWIEIDPVVPQRVFVAIEAGALVRTLDAGATWEDRVPDGPFDTHTMATHRDAPHRLYSAAGDGYFESSDAGLTWQRDVRGLNHRYLVGVTVDPGDPSTVLVSASSGPWHAYHPKTAESFVYRKIAGTTWTAIRDGLPAAGGTTVTHFADTREPGVIYAANNRGVFRSDDAGLRWTPEDAPWDPRYEVQGVLALLALGDS